MLLNNKVLPYLVLISLIFNILYVPLGNAAEYIIGSDDVIDIRVWRHDDLNRIVTVGPDGKITLPLIGTVTASGLTPAQLREKLTIEFSRYIRNPQVTLTMREYHNYKVSVLGEVVRQGSYNIFGAGILMDIITLAGGLTPRADLSKIKVIRGDPKNPTTFNISVSQPIIFAESIQQSTLQPGDTIYIPAYQEVRVTLLGGVARPGSYNAFGAVRLIDVLSLAGGATPRANLKNIKVMRGDPKNPISFTIDANKLLSFEGEIEKWTIQPGDIIHIPEFSLRVSILGEVAKPGSYEVYGASSVMEIISAAGGPTAKANIGKTKVTRGDPKNPVTFDVEASKILKYGEEVKDWTIQPGDILYVPEYSLRISIMGGVNRPGLYEVYGARSIMDIILLAGGPTPRADLKNIKITRGEAKSVATLVVEAGSPLILGENVSDWTIQPGDTITVPEYSLRVLVSGGVTKPGYYDIFGAPTMLDVISLAGGPTPRADLRKIKIIKGDPKNPTEQIVGKDLPLVFRDEVKDWTIQPGDTITVTENSLKVSVIGEVVKQGSYEAYGSSVVMDIISLAGGPSPRANLKKIQVMRGDPKKPQTFPVDINQPLVFGEEVKDWTIQPSDIIKVGRTGWSTTTEVLTLISIITGALAVYSIFTR